MRLINLTLMLGSFLLVPIVSYANSANVGKLMPQYEKVQVALTEDDLPTAQEAAKALAVSAKQDAVAKKTALNGLSLSIANAPDIDKAREQFQLLTDAMQKLIETHGADNHDNIYLMHCPMARSGKGGTWIQAHDKVTNPYEGQKMLGCGSVKKELEQGPAAKANE